MPYGPPDLGDMRAHDVALSHLNARGFIQFHPLLAQRLDDFKAAIFLGHALYWSKHLAQQQPHRKGWFFMTASQWTQATGLSTREQTSVRAALVARGLLLEALAGRPAVMHYKVDLEATAQLLGQAEMTWVSMTQLFRSSVRFYKPLADICSSVGAGLYLSFLLQRQSHAMRNPPSEHSVVALFPGEFVYRPEQARIALCLGIKAQRNAREKLKASGFIREGRSSHEAVATRVNLAAIASCLQAQGDRTIRKSAPRKSTQLPVGDIAPDLSVVKTSKAKHSAPAASLKRSDATLPQRQLNLFTPVGLIAQWHVDRSNGDKLAPQDDAASLSLAKTEAISSPVGLVMSMFKAGHVGQINSHHAAATTATQDAADAKLSTILDTSGNRTALLSNAICPFVDPNLPFCRNYKQQGISRYFQTTTTRPVDNFLDAKPSRRRIQNQENGEIRVCRTAVNQKINSEAPNRANECCFEDSGYLTSTDHEKPLKTPQIQPSDVADLKEPVSKALAEVGSYLILPEQLGAASRAGVLSMIARAPIELQQPFLDELAGNLANPAKKIQNPIGWLYSLIQQQRVSGVELALAPQVAMLRARRQQHLIRLAGSSVGTQAMAPASGAAEAEIDTNSEVKRNHLQRLEELKKSFATSSGGRR